MAMTYDPNEPRAPKPKVKPGIDQTGAVPNTGAPALPPVGPTADAAVPPTPPGIDRDPARRGDIDRVPPDRDGLPPGPDRGNRGPQPPPSTPPATPPPPTPPEPGSAPLTQQDRGRFMEMARTYPPTTAGLDQLIREHPELGITRISNGDIRLPDGEIIDVIYAADIGGGRWQWLTGVSQTGGSNSGVSASVQQPAVSNYSDQVRQIIMAQLADLSRPYDPNADPQYDIAMGAAESQAQRVRQQKQKEAAERLTAQGYSVAGGGGALEGEIDELFNEQSYQLSGLAGEMVTRALQDRRNQMMTLLNMAMASGDAETAQAVQLQMAAIDAELRRIGMNQQQSQWDDQMDLNWAEFGADNL